MIQKVPRWLLFTGALLVPAIAFAATAAPTGWCPSLCSALFGCGG